MNKAMKIIYVVMFIIFAAVFLVSAFVVGRYVIDSRQQSEQYDSLSDRVNQIKEQPDDVTVPEVTVTTPYTVPESHEPGTILPEYAEIYLMNTDMVGWISIPDTRIDYPVLQTPDNPDYYLVHTFFKEYNGHGAIYVREACDVNKPSDNLTIYGHHMYDNTMFADLDKFKKEDFWADHRTFTFDTLTERHTYEVMCVFKTSGYVDEGFPYHLFVDAKDEAEFNEFVSTCKSLAFYETGVTAEYGDKLICLSTCEYTQENGRFVLVAKRIS